MIYENSIFKKIKKPAKLKDFKKKLNRIYPKYWFFSLKDKNFRDISFIINEEGLN